VDVTFPKASKTWRKSPSVALYDRLPMKSFILILLNQQGEVFADNLTLGVFCAPYETSWLKRLEASIWPDILN
jgi:hypothetical protein